MVHINPVRKKIWIVTAVQQCSWSIHFLECWRKRPGPSQWELKINKKLTEVKRINPTLSQQLEFILTGIRPKWTMVRIVRTRSSSLINRRGFLGRKKRKL